MIISAATHGTDWMIFHVPTAKQVKFVLWVDDEKNEYCRLLADGLKAFDPATPSIVEKAQRIDILMLIRTILIDPVEDDEQQYRLLQEAESA